jgi:hypothetical protein
VVEIKPTIDKILKIKKLQPKYAIANVFHNSDDKNTPLLEQELLRFPVAAHDDICFVAGTKILTDKGQKNIEDIELDDLVMTRKGLRKVSYWAMTGKKKVTTNKHIGLTGTYNHPVIVKKFGIDYVKNLISVNPFDTLYIWNEKLLCIEKKNIIGTRTLKEGNLGYIFGGMISGKVLQLLSIGRYGLIILEKFLKIIMSIIRMAILLIIFVPIWNLYLLVNTPQDTQKRNGKTKNIGKKMLRILEILDTSQKNGMGQKKEESGIASIAMIFGKIENLLKSVVFYVVKSLCRKTERQNIVVPIMEINLEKKTRSDLREVYNLQVEGCHEYFANGILVHNCDCLSNIIEIMMPVQKTIDRTYRKFQEVRKSGASVAY